MPSSWFIKAAIPQSQKEAVEKTLLAHGIDLNALRSVDLPETGYLPPFLELVFSVKPEDALSIAKAIAHAAKTENPKASKIFLLKNTDSVHLRV